MDPDESSQKLRHDDWQVCIRGRDLAKGQLPLTNWLDTKTTRGSIPMT